MDMRISLRLAHSIAIRQPALHSPQHRRLRKRRIPAIKTSAGRQTPLDTHIHFFSDTQ
jgi:hypothetical protein